MGTTPQRGGDNWQSRIGAERLELLHQEADGTLSVAQQATLKKALATDPALSDAHTALRETVQLLLLRPQLSTSLAPAVVQDIRLAKQLTPAPLPVSGAAQVAAEIAAGQILGNALASPPLPRSVAAAVREDIALERAFRSSPVPPLSASLAPAVLGELRAARAIGMPPLPPRSVSAAVTAQIVRDTEGSDASIRAALQQAALPPHPSVATALAVRIAQEAQGEALPPAAPPRSASALTVAQPPRFHLSGQRAPLVLVGGLLAGLTLLTVSSAWPNLPAGALILQTLLENIAPLTGLGLLLLVLTSALVTWTPTPPVRRFGAAAFAVAGILTLPPLYQVTSGGHGLSFGQTVVVRGHVPGNIVSIGGDVRLEKNAHVGGQVVTLLGDIQQMPGAQVAGQTSALLGRAPGEHPNVTTPPQGVGVDIATAAAFRPLIGWLGAAAWPQIFVTLTGGLLLLLFVGGIAPVLARRQRHAPIQSLALGILMLSALLAPAVALGLAGLLGPSLLALTLVSLLIATGLSVSLYDAGRALACRLRLPVPDTVGAVLGLSVFAASLSWPPLAFVLAFTGGAWGAGTLVLYRQSKRR